MPASLQYQNVLHMANELPYFEVDKAGVIRLKDLGYSIIDCHAHLANNFLFAKPIDYWRESPGSGTFFSLQGMPVDLSLYSGANLAANDQHSHLHFIQTVVTSKIGLMPCHSAANLLREMNEMGVSHAVVLAIDLPFVSRNSDQILDVYEKETRLLPFVSVHPADPFWREKLDRYVERGARGLKIHPEMQGVAMDSPQWRKILKRWRSANLPVLCHTSVSPVQPGLVKGGGVARSHLSRFESLFDEFGDIPIFMGHGSMMEYRSLIALAKKHPNCICELDGQPPSHLEAFFSEVNHDQLVTGSDWPVYPLAYQYAKMLIATEGDKTLRFKVFHGNAARLLKIEGDFNGKI